MMVLPQTNKYRSRAHAMPKKSPVIYHWVLTFLIVQGRQYHLPRLNLIPVPQRSAQDEGKVSTSRVSQQSTRGYQCQ